MYDKKYAELGDSVIDYVNDREDRIEDSFENLFQKGRIDGEDLDEITKDGLYAVVSKSVIIDGFGDYYGFLEVSSSFNGLHTIQTFTNHTNSVRFVRTNWGDRWYSWKKVY